MCAVIQLQLDINNNDDNDDDGSNHDNADVLNE